MKKISRNIYHEYIIGVGDVYTLLIKGESKGKFLNLEDCQMARKEFDFKKESWKPYLDGLTELDFDFKSNIIAHRETKSHYVEVRLPNYEILVSDLYSKFAHVREVKKYLDDNNWSVQALNTQKRLGIEGCRSYSGVLPLHEGYLVIDSDKNEYGLFQKLEDAINLRDDLREKGVII